MGEMKMASFHNTNAAFDAQVHYHASTKQSINQLER